jgi:hypothetical protein
LEIFTINFRGEDTIYLLWFSSRMLVCPAPHLFVRVHRA